MDNLKKPACAPKQDKLVLSTLRNTKNDLNYKSLILTEITSLAIVSKTNKDQYDLLVNISFGKPSSNLSSFQ